MNATASFTTAANQVTITIRNLQPDPKSDTQTVNGVSFTLGDGLTAGSISSSSGTFRDIAGNGAGQFMDTASSNNGWL